ncbi:MAG: DUF421 domain-containing protein [Clostridia bacterium]|nr:DUF421 domain-containing protein [Clostridia bacterium]
MLILIIRTILLYIFVIMAVRIMGKRQLSEMQTTELVITLIIADIASIPMQNTSQPLLTGVIPILILISAEIIISIIMMKSSKIRNLVCGKPEVLINDGNLCQNTLRSLRMTTEDLCVQLRQLGVYNIGDVQFCIIEPNGKLSVQLKPEKRSPNCEQLQVAVQDTGIEAVVISDGEFLKNSMKLCNVDKKWITDILNGEGLTKDDVMIMTANRLKEYNIIRKVK